MKKFEVNFLFFFFLFVRIGGVRRKAKSGELWFAATKRSLSSKNSLTLDSYVSDVSDKKHSYFTVGGKGKLKGGRKEVLGGGGEFYANGCWASKKQNDIRPRIFFHPQVWSQFDGGKKPVRRLMLRFQLQQHIYQRSRRRRCFRI